MNRYRAPQRNGTLKSNPNQGQLPLAPTPEPFANKLERRCAEDPEFLARLAEAVREIGEKSA